MRPLRRRPASLLVAAAAAVLAIGAAAAPAQGAVTYRTTVLAGTGTSGYSGDGGPATSAQISGPIGIDRGADGSIYFADQFNQRVRRIAPNGVISTVAGNGVQGFAGDGGAATAASFSAPSDVAVLPNGQILVSDANNNRIRRFTVGGTINTVAGTGAASFSGDGGAASAAAIRFPYGISVYPDGSYIFADSDNHRIRRVTAGGVISTVAGNGAATFAGDGGQATSASIRQPFDVTRYNDDGFLIADHGNHRIRRVLPTGVISTSIGTGTAGSGGDGLLGPFASLNGPMHVARSYNGHIYVADRFNHKIRYLPSGGVVSTFAGTGTAGTGGINGPASGVQLSQPSGVYVLPAEPGPEDVLIADTFNHRILRVSLADEAATPPGVRVNPSLSGVPKPGTTLTCNPGQYDGDGTSKTIIWELAPRGAADSDGAAWKPIVGANAPTHEVRAIEVGWRIRCREVVINGSGTADATSASLAVDFDVPIIKAGSQPRIDGVAQIGRPLTCNIGEWDNADKFTTSWWVGDQQINNSDVFAASPEHRGQRVRCRVTGRNDVGGSEIVDSPSLLVIRDVPVPAAGSQPFISTYSTGSKPTDRRLECGTGKWVDEDGPYGYRWFRADGSVIEGETGWGYMARVEDLGLAVQCEVTARNQLGESAPQRSKSAVVPLPTTGSQGRLYSAIHGVNYNSPTSMLAVSAEQLTLMDQIIDRRYQELLAATRAACVPRDKTPASFAAFTGRKLPEAQTCWALASGQPIYSMPDGVFWNFGGCYPLRSAAVPLTATVRNVTSFRGIVDYSPPRDFYGTPLCPQLSIDVPPIDRVRAREVDSEIANAFVAASPIKILWDLNGDGRAEASCGPDSPVMRTIPERGKYPNLRAVLVYPDSERTGIYGIAATDFDFSFGQNRQGTLRDEQVFACRTQMDPPPEPELPCVTSATIGRLTVTGNLCPVQTRYVPIGELDAMPLDVQQALREKGLVEGARSTRASVMRSPFVRELFDAGTEAPGEFANTPTLNQFRTQGTAHQVMKMGEPENYNNGALKNRGSDDKRKVLPGVKISAIDTVKLPGWFQPEAMPFATDQIYISKGKVTVNGVTIDPASLTQSAIDGTVAFVPSEVRKAVTSVRSMTVSSSDAALSMLSPKGVLPLTNPQAWKKELDDSIKAPAQQLVRENLDALKQSLKNKLDIGPFKLAGDVDVTIEKDGTATIKASASLPIFTDLDGQSLKAKLELKADQQGNVQLQTINVNAPSALLGPVELRKLDVTYDGGLSVRGQIVFGPKGSGIDITRFRLANGGSFEALGLKYNAGAGQGIKIGPGVFLTQIGGEFDLPGLDFKTGRIKAFAAVSAGPSAGRGCPAAGLVGEVDLNWTRQMFAIDAFAEPVIACVSFGRVNFHADTGGFFRLWGKGGVALGPISVSAELDGRFQLAEKFSDSLFQVHLVGTGKIAGILEGTVQAMVSNKGVAGCGSIKVFQVPLIDELFGEKVEVTVAGGAGIRFIGGVPPITPAQLVAGIRVFVGCDLTDWGAFATRSIDGQRAQAARAVRIEPGQEVAAIAVSGAGGVPRFTITTPDGRKLDYANVPEQLTAMPTGSTAMALPGEARTVVLLAKPHAGDYKIETVPGSPGISNVQQARSLPKPRVRVKVQGSGPKRTLRYEISKIPGQSVRFVEQADGASREIATINGGGKGQRRWTVGEATRNGGRRVVAEITQDGLPRTQLTVARFSAPNPRVARPRGLTVRRSKQGLTVRWKRAASADGYVVRVRYAGRRETYRPEAGKTSLTVPGVARRGRVEVRVVGVSAAGRRGPAATLTSRR